MVVAHPGIGAALETLLRIEGRYEVRRVVALADAAALAATWGADAALVDGVLMAGRTSVRLGAPAIVLSSNAEDGQALARKADDGRGWLRKDSSVDELVSAIDQVVVVRSGGAKGRAPMAYLVVLVLLAVALATVIVYLLGLVLTDQ